MGKFAFWPSAAVLPLSATLLLGMCARAGDRDMTTHRLELEAFDQLEVASALAVTVHLGEAARGEIRGSAGEIGRVQVRQEGGRLRLDLGRGVDLMGGIEVELWTPTLKELELSGATRAVVGELAADELDLDISGAGHATLKGHVGRLTLDLSGAAALEARECRIDRAEVDLSGASRAELTVLKELSADCSGASQLDYWGQPIMKSLDSSGAASVRSRDAQ